jgi:thiol-disulfide isomerase/thioredoxin
MPKLAPAALLALALLPAPARAEQPPDAMALLQQVAQAYHALTSYRFEGLMSVRMTGPMNQTLEVPLEVAADRRGRARVVLQAPQMGMMLVSDGRETVTYLPSLGQYRRKSAEAVADSGGMPDPPQGSPFARYFNLVESLQSARVAGTETIDIAGTPHDCWVVQCDLGTPQALAGDSSAQATATFWIDRARLLVLHDSTAVTTQNAATGARVGMDQVTTFRVGQVNEPLPDSLFVFAVPEGARQVESFQMPGQEKAAAGLVGRQAPAFALNDVSGRRVSLAGLKGRVVVLDFWATWCKPCRIEMPRVEKLYKELKPKGLAVLGVNFGETPATVKRYLSQTPCAFPIVLDRDTNVSILYKADAIPTLVVIDRAGIVRSYFQGVQDESDLRDAILKAGLDQPPPAGAKPAARKAAPGAARSAPRRTPAVAPAARP